MTWLALEGAGVVVELDGRAADQDFFALELLQCGRFAVQHIHIGRHGD